MNKKNLLYLPSLVGISLLKRAMGDIHNKLPLHISAINLYACFRVCQRRDRSGWHIAGENDINFLV